MINDKIAQDKLLSITTRHNSSYQQWNNTQFSVFKGLSTTEKGNTGEDFLASILKLCGYSDVNVLEGRRGHYDVIFKHNKKEILFEVKVATKDVNGSFQFNGIRYDTKYTHLFCLGISPDKIGYLIIKKELVGTDKYKMVSMAKGSNSSFKLTKKENLLNSFDEFDTDIRSIVK